MLDRSCRILVIEDNPTNLELLMFLLRANGHSPIAAHDGVSGLQKAAKLDPDLIICDIQLPTIDGYEVARRIKTHQRLQHITLLAVTACAMPADRDRALEAGFDGYISKPISPYTFCDAIARYLPSSESQERRPSVHDEGANSILVAEHSALNLSVLAAVLSSLGRPYDVTRSVTEAVSDLKRSEHSLLITELELPGGGAERLFQSLHQLDYLRDLPTLLLAPGGTVVESVGPLQRLYQCELMHWPIDPAHLLQWVKDHTFMVQADTTGALNP